MEAYQKKYQGFKDRDAVRVVIPLCGAKVLGSTTRTDYKVEQGGFRSAKYVCVHEGNQGISKCMELMIHIPRY